MDIQRAAQLLRQAGQVVLTTHAKPDADGYGAVVALTGALKRLGCDARGLLMGPVPASLATLPGSDLVQLYEPPTSVVRCDLVVVLDTGAWSQLEPIKAELQGRLDRTLLIDHHLSGDVAAAFMVVDPTAAACCELVAELLDEWADDGEVYEDPIVCAALYLGLAGDTGWFRFSNTSARTHELAARLLRRGVDHAAIHRHLQQAERPQKLALLARALAGCRLLAQNRVALMVLKAADFAQTQALVEETEQIVDLPQMVAQVKMVILVTESPSPDGSPPEIRLSFRSKPGPDAIDVARLARAFGGGGHARAAGARHGGPLATVVQRVTEAARTAVGPGP